MKKDKLEKEIMNYIDGISYDIEDSTDFAQAKELKQLVSDLKAIPLASIDDNIDDRLYEFISNEQIAKKPIINIKKLLPFTLVAASIIIMLFVFSNNKTTEDHYKLLTSNPDKISYVYSLNNTNLKSSDIEWLQAELKNDIHPTVKVTIVDLLAQYQSELNEEFYNNLQQESIPSVQMALLTVAESSTHIDVSNTLMAFTLREDLDTSVRQKATYILSNQ